MEKDNRTLIIFPVFNEESSLPTIVDFIRTQNLTHLFYDDGSYDDSRNILIESKVNYLLNDDNKGIAHVYRNGLNYAIDNGFENVLFCDSDLQHPLQSIKSFINEKEHVIVSGNRFSLNNLGSIPHSKIASNLFASMLIEEEFKLFIPDVSCGMKRIPSKLEVKNSNNFEIVYDILLHSITNGKKINFINIPVVYFPHKLYTTKHIEILSLLNSILRIKSSPKIVSLKQRIKKLEKSFSIQIKNQTFYFFLNCEFNSYNIQTDINKAIIKYESYYFKN